MATLVLAALVAAGYWQLQRDTEARMGQQAQQRADAKLLDCPELGHVLQLRLQNAHGDMLLERRAVAQATPKAQGPNENSTEQIQALQTGDAQGTWQLVVTTPNGALRTEADDDAVQALLGASCALSQLGPPTQPVPGSDGSQAFGLAPPQQTLRLKSFAGATQVLEAGAKNNFDGSLFVRRGGEDLVRRVDGAFAFQLERDVFALRNKRLLRLQSSDVVAVALEAAAAAKDPSNKKAVGPFVLRHTEAGFVLEAGGKVQQADATQAQSLVAALSELRAKQFVAEAPTPQELGRYGLAKPHLTVRLTDRGGTTTTLRLGRIFLGDTAHDFAQVGEADAAVAELPSPWLVEKLSQGTSELRDMHVLALEAQQVATLRICSDATAQASCVAFRREGEADVPHGRRAFVFDANGTTVPLPTGPAHAQRIATLVGRLAELRADDFAPAPRPGDAASEAAWHRAAGLGEGAMVLTFADPAGNLLASLRAGRVDGRHRLVFGNKRPEVARIFAAVLEGVTTQPADYVDPDPVAQDAR